MPKVLSSVKSPIDEAGTTQNCPHCRTQFVVPGTEERERIGQELFVARREKEQAALLGQRQRQQEKEEREQIAALERALGAPRTSWYFARRFQVLAFKWTI